MNKFSLLLLAALLSGCSKKSQPSVALPKTDSFPHTLVELSAWYAEPGYGRNAAAIYEQAFAAMQPDSLSTPLSNDSITGTTKSAAAQCLRANAVAFQLLIDASRFDGCRYNVDLTKGFEAPLPHLMKIKPAAALLFAATLLHADAHDGKRSAEDVLAGFALARSLINEPATVSQRSRSAALATATRTLEIAVNRVTLPKEALAELALVLQDMEESEARGDGFTRSIVSERANSISLLHQPAKLVEFLNLPDLELSADQREKIKKRAKPGAKLVEEEQFIAHLFQELLPIRKVPFPARLTQDDLVQRSLSDVAVLQFPALALLLPSLKEQASREAECLARLRLAGTAIALEQFRGSNGGRFPANLTEINAAPIDPFDGGALRYRATPTGYVLYSIGPDLKDNLGAPLKDKQGDIAFVVANFSGHK